MLTDEERTHYEQCIKEEDELRTVLNHEQDYRMTRDNSPNLPLSLKVQRGLSLTKAEKTEQERRKSILAQGELARIMLDGNPKATVRHC